MYNERGEGLAEAVAVLGGLAILAIGIGAPLAQAALTEAQARADVAQANLVLSRGLSTVATANALTPLLLVVAGVIAALALSAIGVAWALVARDYLRLRAQSQRLAQPEHRVSVRGHRPAAALSAPRETWQPVVMTLKEWARLEVQDERD